MSPRKIIIDTDPGQDDAAALMLAFASPEELEILGLCAVAGNVPLSFTSRNLRIVCELCGKPDAKVLLQGRNDNTGQFEPSQAHVKFGAKTGQVLK